MLIEIGAIGVNVLLLSLRALVFFLGHPNRRLSIDDHEELVAVVAILKDVGAFGVELVLEAGEDALRLLIGQVHLLQILDVIDLVVQVEGDVLIAALVTRKLQELDEPVPGFPFLLNLTLLLQKCISEQLIYVQVEHFRKLLLFDLLGFFALGLRRGEALKFGDVEHGLLAGRDFGYDTLLLTGMAMPAIIL